MTPGDADELQGLVDLVLDGSSDVAHSQRLAEILRANRAAREAYLDQVRVHAMLRWRHGLARPSIAPARRPVGASRFAFPRRWAVAAALVLSAALAATLAWRGRDVADPTKLTATNLGEVTDAADVVWSAGQSPLAPGVPLKPQDVSIRSGTPRLRLGKGPGDSVDRPFTVWRRDVRVPGTVTLGDNPAVKSMYGIAATPLP